MQSALSPLEDEQDSSVVVVIVILAIMTWSVPVRC